ncbi:hypothetical protein FHT70_005523 [Rhizobium sp. BK049]|uniref:endonuclease NucS domain-containing protein n=1 Tax=Rhizobium sp. BK049 TaxID=2587095 RepID=UPI00160A608D|nr:endonuclease NucS domain-containing protein [Rhizobium sp. BK049]MBB3355560.1 hypothetical protein [Rhizobium sp. BK049]
MDIQEFWGIRVREKAALAIRLAARPGGTTMGEIHSHSGQDQYEVFRRLKEIGHTVVKEGSGANCRIRLKHKDGKRFKDPEIKGLNGETKLHKTPGLIELRELELQKTLRRNLRRLERGLRVADCGKENNFRDITAVDAKGRQVVIELKAVKATKEVLAQILAYMGEIVVKDGLAKSKMRGIIVAPDFQDKTVYAAIMTPNVSLFRYTLAPLKFERLA